MMPKMICNSPIVTGQVDMVLVPSIAPNAWKIGTGRQTRAVRPVAFRYCLKPIRSPKNRELLLRLKCDRQAALGMPVVPCGGNEREPVIG